MPLKETRTSQEKTQNNHKETKIDYRNMQNSHTETKTCIMTMRRVETTAKRLTEKDKLQLDQDSYNTH